MTEQRFQALAEAFGADLARWPAAERAAAAAFVNAHPAAAEPALAPARRLDEALEAWAAGAPSEALRQAVIASAPAARAVSRAWRWLTGVGLGVALAGACAAGVYVGLTETPRDVVRAISGQHAAEPADEASALLAPSHEDNA